jgi:DNA-directed RNA polymerase subunit M/transcription elongation factor TFIIS
MELNDNYQSNDDDDDESNEWLKKVFCSLKKMSFDEDEEWLKCQILEDLGNNPTEEEAKMYIKNIINEKKLGFEHSIFSDMNKRQKEQDDYVLNPFQAEEGVVQCKKCESFKVYSVSVLTRAADEPMTTVSFCTICKNKWSQNG